MKNWPENGQTVPFRQIINPLRKAILFAYNIKRKNKNRSIPWSGLDIGKEEKSRCFSPNEQLRFRNLKYSENDQGRDALDEILGIAIRLGIEQGRRIVKNSIEYKLMKFKLEQIENQTTNPPCQLQGE